MKELDEGQFDEIIEVEVCPYMLFAWLRKEVFQDIGMMDEKYFVYFDDTDFFI